MTVTLNKAVIILGPGEWGKTTIARAEAKEFLTAYPAGIVFVHDLNSQFPDAARYYETVEEWRAAHAAGKVTRISSFRCDFSAMRDLAVELGRRHNRDTDVKRPIMLIGDEVSLTDTSGSTHQDKGDFAVWGNRRHLGIAPILNSQSQSWVNNKFFVQATDVYILSQLERDARAIEKDKLGLKEGTLDPIVDAPKYRYAHWVRGEGVRFR